MMACTREPSLRMTNLCARLSDGNLSKGQVQFYFLSLLAVQDFSSLDFCVLTPPNFISSKRLDTWKPKMTAVAEFSFAEPLEVFKQFLGDIRFDPARIV